MRFGECTNCGGNLATCSCGKQKGLYFAPMPKHNTERLNNMIKRHVFNTLYPNPHGVNQDIEMRKNK